MMAELDHIYPLKNVIKNKYLLYHNVELKEQINNFIQIC